MKIIFYITIIFVSFHTVAIIDSKRAANYNDAIDHFKSSGHHVTVIGLEEDWKMLLPLATVGFDRRSNLFLFDEIELENIIGHLDSKFFFYRFIVNFFQRS